MTVDLFDILQHYIIHTVVVAYILHRLCNGLCEAWDTSGDVVGNVKHNGIGVKFLKSRQEFAECRAEAF